MNFQMKKDETWLYQESMHFDYGRDIDLVFPNAKAWIAIGGVHFLSNNSFRALQTYNIALVDFEVPIGKIGKKFKILSDDNFGVV
jgi:hypothetical protein